MASRHAMLDVLIMAGSLGDESFCTRTVKTKMPGLRTQNYFDMSIGRIKSSSHLAPARSDLMLPVCRFRRRQFLHFTLCVVVPFIVTVAAPLALPVGVFFYRGVAIAIFMWFIIGCFGISVGYHRHFAHRAFRATRSLRLLFAVTGSMAAQGPPVYWVAIHRRHHAYSDRPGDPHSPRTEAEKARGRVYQFLMSHIGWAVSHDVPAPSRYAKDLLADPVIALVSKNYWWCVGLGLVLPACIGSALIGGLVGIAAGVYWGGAVRITVGHQIIWSINSVCHTFGSRPHATQDFSSNCALLALPSFGESWHNNHHYRPSSPAFGEHWWQLDIGLLTIRALEFLNLATGVRTAKR